MTSNAPLLYHRSDDHIATLQFNRPDVLNALDLASAQAFRAAVRDIAQTPGVRAVLLKGSGRAFMAGGDLASLRANPQQSAHALLTVLNPAIALLQEIDAPVIAQVHGAVAGAGLSLMLACDFALAADDTRFNLAYIKIGTSCDVGASWVLPRLVGLRHALEIALLGEDLSAKDALRLGLVNRLLPAEDLDATALALAARLAEGPTIAYGHMRRLMRGSFNHSLPVQLDREAAAFATCTASEDMREGITAFFEKRKPQFRGK